MIQELEKVALTEDLPEHGLLTGDIGMIVHIYGEHHGYAVEFVGLHGDLIALVSLAPSKIRSLEKDEIATARRVKVI